MHPLVERHRNELKALASRHGLWDVHVFGSMPRDDADANSDVDLLVDVPPGASAFVLGAMLMDAQDLLGRRVDIVTRSALNPPA
jgi:predicted nucleotidyltransferase